MCSFWCDLFASGGMCSAGGSAALYGLVSRMGGDEFVVLTEMQQVDDIDAKLKKTAVELGEVRISDCGEENARNTHFSAGIAKYPADADNLAELKKCADSALYTVKERGRNGFDWYKSQNEINI